MPTWQCMHGLCPLIDGFIFYFILENLIGDVFECTDMLIELLQNEREREREICLI